MYCIVRYDFRKNESICIAFSPNLNEIRDICDKYITEFVRQKNSDPESPKLFTRYNENYHTAYIYKKIETIQRGYIYNTYVYDTKDIYSFNITCVLDNKNPFNIRLTHSSIIFRKDNLNHSKVKSVDLINELKQYFKDRNMENIE